MENDKMRKFWKIYFFLMIGIMAIEFVMRLYFSSWFMNELYLSICNQGELLIALISLVGMYGFIYKKKIISNIFWIVFFILVALYSIWDIYLDVQLNSKLNNMYPTEPDILESIIDFFLNYILGLPLYIGLFIYGFRSKEIWKS